MSIIPEYKYYFLPMYEYFSKNIANVNYFEFDHIYYTDNFSEDIFLFETPSNNDNLNALGTTILPNANIDSPIILINIKPHNDYQYAQILFHELLHVIDYMKFSDYFLDGKYDNIYKQKYFYTYKRWMEFKAYSMDELLATQYIDYIENKNSFRSAMLSYDQYLYNYLKNQAEYFEKEQINDYDLVKILGKIYAFDKYNHTSCINDYLNIVINNKCLLANLYELYHLYIVSDQNQNIFSNLNKIQNVERCIFGDL